MAREAPLGGCIGRIRSTLEGLAGGFFRRSHPPLERLSAHLEDSRTAGRTEPRSPRLSGRQRLAPHDDLSQGQVPPVEHDQVRTRAGGQHPELALSS